MRSIRYCLYLLVLSVNSLFAQEELGTGLLLPQFEKGIVHFKDKKYSAASLNYDMLRQKMLFLNADSTVLEISNRGYSQSSSVTTYESWQDNVGNSVKLKQDEKFMLKIDCAYYLKSGNSYKRFSTAKALGKLFKGYESEIEKFANEQSINFSKLEDVAQIVEYGYSLTQ